MKRWERITEEQLLARLNAGLAEAGLPPWPGSAMDRDLLFKYLKGSDRPYA